MRHTMDNAEERREGTTTTSWMHCLGQWLLFLCWTLPILLFDGLRLFLFVIVLAPGFARFFWYYTVTSNRASIRYDDKSCRQTLDVYLPSSWQEKANSIKKRQNNNENRRHTNLTTPSSSDPCASCRECLLDQREVQVSSSSSTTSRAKNHHKAAPVVIFFTGGAWIIGYKMWGALLARALTAAGLIVVIPDYRNYPWACIPAAVDEDVEQSIQWTLDNISMYGGNPQHVILVGQSAGGHLLCTALLRKALGLSASSVSSPRDDDDNENGDDNNSSNTRPCWQPTDFIGFISLSAPYNLQVMKRTFRRHGLNGNLVSRIFGFQKEEFEPSVLVQDYLDRQQQQREDQREGEEEKLKLKLPPIRIYHGTRDKTVPSDGSQDFAEALGQAVLVAAEGDDRDGDADNSSSSGGVSFLPYPGWSHTDAILEGPMDANHRFHCDIFQAVQDWTTRAQNSSFTKVEQENRISLAGRVATTLTTADQRDALDAQQQQQQQMIVPTSCTETNDSNSESIQVLLSWPADDPVIQNRLCPHMLVQIGRWCNPF